MTEPTRPTRRRARVDRERARRRRGRRPVGRSPRDSASSRARCSRALALGAVHGLAPCHGEASASPLRFDPGVDGAFGVAATRRNYREALVHLSLGGHPELSRLARKPLRDRDDGPAAPRRQRAQRASRRRSTTRCRARWWSGRGSSAGCAAAEGDGGLDSEIAFVGGPIGAARVVEHDGFAPGATCICSSPPAPRRRGVRNLTASAPRGRPPTCVDPAVDDAGTRAGLLACARGRDAPRVLWELDLRTGGRTPDHRGVRLPDGRWSADRWPAYGPDGRLWFVSDRAGMLAEHADGYDTDLYVLELDGNAHPPLVHPEPRAGHDLLPLRAARPAARWPSRRSAGWATATRASSIASPTTSTAEYHQHVGITLGDDITWHMRETARRRLRRAAARPRRRVVRRGAGARRPQPRHRAAHGLVPRGVAPGLPPRRSTYLGPYGSPAEAILDPYAPEKRATPRFAAWRAMGAWRDPHPLPDGRIVASWAEGTVRLCEPLRAAGLRALRRHPRARPRHRRAAHRASRAPRRSARRLRDAARPGVPQRARAERRAPRPTATAAASSTTAPR